MKILVLNCGSSSLKYQLLDMTDESIITKGNFEKIGEGGSFLTYKIGSEKFKIEEEVDNHEQAIKIVLKQLIDSEHGVLSSLEEIAATGHRIVHGGEKFTHSVVVDDEVIEELKRCIDFAPLHNPAAIKGLEACKKEMPNKPMVIVVDTAFHQTIPEERYIYPIPYEYYKKYKIRKYGAHGTSHRYVAHRVAELIGKPVENLKIVNCHLGQGASLCAIKNGVCVDTTMGFTPLAGIAMGTRSGDLDPSVVTYIMKKENISPDEMSNILNKKSGLLGISELSGDNRDLLQEIDSNGEKAKQSELALKSYTYIIAQYIAKCAVAMNGVDVISFSGGVGERGPDERKMICEYLEFLGVKLDLEANKIKAEEKRISSEDSKINVWIVPTEEELMIARDTQELILDR